MCGRYTLTKNTDELEGRFSFSSSSFDWVPRYNIAPSQEVAVVLADGERRAELMRWGLIPFWAKDPKIGSRMINARAETVAEKPSFRRPLRSMRCLILADGFYEWRKTAGKRVPMRVRLKSGEAFAFAGLYDNWKSPSDEWTRSCTIITTSANPLVGAIHDRMPVILSGEAEEVWLDRAVEDSGALTQLLAPYDAEEMEAYAVSTLVNAPGNDSPECIVPLAEKWPLRP